MQYDGFSTRWPVLCLLALLAIQTACAADTTDPARGSTSSTPPPAAATPSTGCLAEGDGYFRARITGALDVDVQWQDPEFTCDGALRPENRGVRMSFKGPLSPKPPSSSDGATADLVIVLGISQLRENQSKARAIPVNVTVIKQGSGEFYGTQGEDKCMLDEILQTPLTDSAANQRAYRVVARGFCTEPARAIRGQGAILISRFDFAGRIDFASEDADAPSDPPPPPSTN